MSVNNSNKRKGKANPSTGALNTASKPKPRSPKEKPDSEVVDTNGIYDNPTFMHASATVVGCLCHLQVVSGLVYEGIFLTFSEHLEVVLSMVQCLGSPPLPPSLSSPTSSISSLLEVEIEVIDIMVFDFKDIVKLQFLDVDLDYAIKDFTDTGISKFNGQVQERELEPWEGGTDGDSSSSLLGVETGGPVGPLAPLGTLTSAGGGGGQQNGWDVNEMFRTNAEKYGVTSTYDDNLIGYTVQLEKKNTPEYQRRELEAIKVANEINNSAASKNRLQLENGDDDKSSAVVRPTPQDNRYMSQQKKKPVHGGQKPMRNASSRQPGQYRPHTPSPPVRLPQRQADSPTTAVDGGEEQHKAQQRPPESPRVASPPPLSTSAFPPRRRDSADKKSPQQKGREDIEDLKKFQAKFKINVYPEEAAQPPSQEEEVTPPVEAETPPAPTPPAPVVATTTTEEEALPATETPPPAPDTAKSPSKPFVWNLNAKSFTPRNQPPAAATTPPAAPPAMVPQAGNRVPPQQLAAAPPTGNTPMSFIPQHFIHSYVPQLTQTSYMLPTATASRMKKMDRNQWQEIRMPPRHELTPVAAATGPPILTPSPSAASQSLVQYHHHHAAASAGGHPQLYPQMYQVMGPPRLMPPPPPVPMVPSNTAAAYGGDLHAAATSIYVTHPGNSAAGLGSSNGPPTPQTAPSPVHQPQTPSSHAQPLMYPAAGYGPAGATPAGHMVLMSHHHGPTPTAVHPGLHGQATPPIHTSPYTTATHHQEAGHGIPMRNWYPALYLLSNDGRRPNQGDSQPPCFGGQQDHN